MPKVPLFLLFLSLRYDDKDTLIENFILRKIVHIVLFEPEIPQNTGNIVRLCAVTGVNLHLIKPLGFSVEDRYLKRAGLDYWEHAKVCIWDNFKSYVSDAGRGKRLVMTSSKGGDPLHHFAFSHDDSFIFGPETRGLPQDILEQKDIGLRIPMRPHMRSLNLATAAGIVLYGALGQCGCLDAWI